MRSLALVACWLAWGTGCTIHVVEQPAVAMVQPAPVYYAAHPAPGHGARPSAARPIHRHVEPARRPPPSRPAPVETVAEKPRPVVSGMPREPRPMQVAAKPKPSPVVDKPRPSKSHARPVRPVRPVRDAGPPAVAKPGGHPGRQHEHSDSQHEHSDSQHERAHAMKR